MAKVTGKYETLFIVNPTLGEEEIAALVQKFQSLVEANGTVDKVEDWGKRRMAYAISYMHEGRHIDLNEGYYTLIQFTSAPSFPAELDRIYKITDGVMRSIIVSLD